MLSKLVITLTLTILIAFTEQVITNTYMFKAKCDKCMINYNKGYSTVLNKCIEDTGCVYMVTQDGNHMVKSITDKGYTLANEEISDTMIELANGLYFDYNTLMIGAKVDSIHILFIDSLMLNKNNLLVVAVSSPLHALFITYLVMLLSKDKKKHNEIKNKMNEYSVELRGVVMFAENLNHEVDNSNSVIRNKTRVLQSSCNDKATMEDKKNFEYILVASDQIESVTKKLQGIKHFKHNSENRSLYEVCYKAFEFATLGNHTVKTKVDDELLKYKAEVISNADLHGRLINHIKNSIEANAGMVQIVLGKLTKKRIHLYVIDDGNGVDDSIKNTLFNENTSTKKKEGYVGGNGMYINRQIMKAYGGDIRLVNSEAGNTIFELILEYKKIGEE